MYCTLVHEKLKKDLKRAEMFAQYSREDTRKRCKYTQASRDAKCRADENEVVKLTQELLEYTNTYSEYIR